ncbi:hypothetical protein [Paenibacillus naphthalenovorans]|uniref:hypothetical protein n=1 Tax=Paenibacillus naphthalenovorans TaxID=162209 RepID=UPI00088FCB8C|nr:hypothetical protein [Paenibacillus naphthalenovorans]SDJ35435.1 hypothetical protein SAMN05421868_12463 [Paenibacillus naphthalenovorans]
MPSLLRKDSIRLLEASINSLSLATIGLALPLRHEPRERSSLYAAEIGLIGAAAEQAVNACIVQSLGLKGLLLPDGKFKSATQTFDEFINLLKSASPRISFLFSGIQDQIEHRQKLLSRVSRFRLLAKSRAGGLHAGIGPAREVAISLAIDISEFLNELGRSSRIKPYLGTIPRPHDVVKDKVTLIEELAVKLNRSERIDEKAAYLSSAFLIIPDIDDVQPEWLDAFERINIVPTSNDIVLLLDALNKAVPTSLMRSTGEGVAIPVRVEPNNPSAIPISPQFLRREFNQLNEQWHADAGNANGRLKKGILDLPPQDFIWDIFGIGIENLNILEKESGLPAQQTWPFIATSLSSSGTILPYWFIVRRTEILKELDAIMKRVEKYSKSYLKRNLREFYIGLECLIKEKPLAEDSQLFLDIAYLYSTVDEKRSNLNSVISNKISYSSNDQRFDEIANRVLKEELSLSDALIKISKLTTSDKSLKTYWIRTFAECCYDEEDVPGLLSTIRAEDVQPAAKTAVRKSLRLIDFLCNGPET